MVKTTIKKAGIEASERRKMKRATRKTHVQKKAETKTGTRFGQSLQGPVGSRFFVVVCS